jgi:2-dehydro-3-deoxygluconokinase
MSGRAGGRFLCIGECMVEMASIGGNQFRQGFAGDSFNTAWYARRALPASWDVDYFTTVGDDPVSGRMLDFMASQGIGTRLIRRLPGRTPGLYLIELDRGERSFTYWRDSSAARSLADDPGALAAAVTEADAVYFSGITLAILPPERRRAFLDVLVKVKTSGRLIAFDSNIRLRLWPDQEELKAAIMAAARVATVVLPTIPDESDVFGETDRRTVVSRYRSLSVPEIVVRAGAAPARVAYEGEETDVAPETVVQPVDTTGAGDSFNGTYLAARLMGRDPVTAARLAHDVAGQVIRQHGALVETA